MNQRLKSINQLSKLMYAEFEINESMIEVNERMIQIIETMIDLMIKINE